MKNLKKIATICILVITIKESFYVLEMLHNFIYTVLDSGEYLFQYAWEDITK